MNKIHPSVVIGKNVKIGTNVEIGPYTFIGDNVIIGDNTVVYNHCSIGTPGESIYDEPHSQSGVIIGDNTVIREFVTVNSSLGAQHKTKIGNNCYLMTKSYLAHDCQIGDNVIMCAGSKVAGYCKIGDFTYIGMNASIHQKSEIGKFCVIGAQAFFKGFSIDGLCWVGVPAVAKKINLIGLKRAGLSQKQIEEIRKCFDLQK